MPVSASARWKHAGTRRRTQIAPDVGNRTRRDRFHLFTEANARATAREKKMNARARVTWKSAPSNPDPVFQPCPGSWPSIVSPLLAMASRPKCFGSFPGIRRCNDPREFMASRGVSSRALATFPSAMTLSVIDTAFRDPLARWDHLWPGRIEAI